MMAPVVASRGPMTYSRGRITTGAAEGPLEADDISPLFSLFYVVGLTLIPMYQAHLCSLLLMLPYGDVAPYRSVSQHMTFLPAMQWELWDDMARLSI